eukprot:CAMPEP_0195047756 /NCGR_PEP_ID=MMETSP0347-20130606/39667_1 /TAXON_ID=2932 /ORGANISM="Alexandrium fundyense, Strain CCMP1719" /LENGTH=38 /DNA_ID= /DNA_START= /DNA_END= /DNA_ORIENTATION=
MTRKLIVCVGTPGWLSAICVAIMQLARNMPVNVYQIFV